jgi:hypothetical protein
VQDMWRGTEHFHVLQEVPYKGEIQLLDIEGEAYIYIQQISKKNVCILNFTLFKNKYLGLRVSFY